MKGLLRIVCDFCYAWLGVVLTVLDGGRVMFEQKSIKKKEKKVKDPNAPKRPKSAYMEYVRRPW